MADTVAWMSTTTWSRNSGWRSYEQCVPEGFTMDPCFNRGWRLNILSLTLRQEPWCNSEWLVQFSRTHSRFSILPSGESTASSPKRLSSYLPKSSSSPVWTITMTRWPVYRPVQPVRNAAACLVFILRLKIQHMPPHFWTPFTGFRWPPAFNPSLRYRHTKLRMAIPLPIFRQ